MQFLAQVIGLGMGLVAAGFLFHKGVMWAEYPPWEQYEEPDDYPAPRNGMVFDVVGVDFDPSRDDSGKHMGIIVNHYDIEFTAGMQIVLLQPDSDG